MLVTPSAAISARGPPSGGEDQRAHPDDHPPVEAIGERFAVEREDERRPPCRDGEDADRRCAARHLEDSQPAATTHPRPSPEIERAASAARKAR